MIRRSFIKKASFCSMSLPVIANLNCSNIAGSEKKVLKDNLWLWGHNAGGHHKPVNFYNLHGENLMEPKEECDYMGIRNCIRVAIGKEGLPKPPFDNEAKKLMGLDNVVWSAIGDSASSRHNKDQSDLDEILSIAQDYKFISGAILDDFFTGPNADGEIARHSVESITVMCDKLHNFENRPLDLWVVCYKHQLNYELERYINLFDVLTLWEWNGSNLVNLDNNIQAFINKTPNKRRYVGCYLWNYGERMPMTTKQIEHQLKVCLQRIKKSDIEGVVFLANTVVDIGIESVEYARNWIIEYGQTEIKA